MLKLRKFYDLVGPVLIGTFVIWGNFGMGTALQAAQEPAICVLEVSGQTEVMGPTMRRWSPLRRETALKAGSKVRTGKKGSAHLVHGKDLETAVKLDRNSQLVLDRGNALTVSLEKGRLFVLREEGALGSFEVRSRHLKARMGLGGCIFDVTKKGVLVRVYGDDITFGNTTLQEGHKLWQSSAKGKAPSKERMIYADIVEWQAWIRQWYEMRDDHFAERLEKEMDL